MRRSTLILILCSAAVCNIEVMFPHKMPRPERMQRAADQGFKFYSFWSAIDAEQDAMLKVQQQSGMTCASITGTGSLEN